MNQWLGLTMVSAAAMLAACGGGSDLGGGTETDLSGARGSLMHNPPLRVTALSAGEFKDRLAASPSGQSLLALAGAPKCGVDVHYIEYGTVGGAVATTADTVRAGRGLIMETTREPHPLGAVPCRIR